MDEAEPGCGRSGRAVKAWRPPALSRVVSIRLCGNENNRVDGKGELAAATPAGFSRVAAISHAGGACAAPARAHGMRHKSLISNDFIDKNAGLISVCRVRGRPSSTPRKSRKSSPGIPHGAASRNIVGGPLINPGIDTAFIPVIKPAGALPKAPCTPRAAPGRMSWPGWVPGRRPAGRLGTCRCAARGAVPRPLQEVTMTIRPDVFQGNLPREARVRRDARQEHRP